MPVITYLDSSYDFPNFFEAYFDLVSKYVSLIKTCLESFRFQKESRKIVFDYPRSRSKRIETKILNLNFKSLPISSIPIYQLLMRTSSWTRSMTMMRMMFRVFTVRRFIKLFFHFRRERSFFH